MTVTHAKQHGHGHVLLGMGHGQQFHLDFKCGYIGIAWHVPTNKFFMNSHNHVPLALHKLSRVIF